MFLFAFKSESRTIIAFLSADITKKAHFLSDWIILEQKIKETTTKVLPDSKSIHTLHMGSPIPRLVGFQ